ncbi:hypothetical protein [Streptomyces sp. DH12]|uniref:hypothetical protein n=1 Tax=Streptomyces sp. DH12 TaxID=2857010 RepID=UPI001E2EA5F5|nr:hypothetical protein [Streptomyces sp. DH12]
MPGPDARAELLIGGTWVDATDDTRSGPRMRYSWGASGASGQVDPARLDLTLSNPGGKYSRRNPLSPYYGLLGRNTPLRLSTYAGETVLDIPHGTGGRATTPDTAALDITGDIDVRIELEPETWAGAPYAADGYELMGKYNAATNQRSWRLLMMENGLIQFAYSTDGTNFIPWQCDPLPLAPGQRAAVRVTMDVDNGAGGHVLTFYYAPTIAGPWTQHYRLVNSGVTSIFASTAPLEVGDISSIGFGMVARRVYAAEVRNGIAGTVVANPVFTSQVPGATSFADGVGRTWTVGGGASLTDRRVRGLLEVPQWPVDWHVSGHNVTAPLQAAGIMRRLGRGRKPLASTLRRRIPSYQPLAYWPLEDEDGASRAASGLPGGDVLYTLGMRFAADTSMPGSDALPTVQTGTRLNGAVPAPAGPATAWHLEFMYRLPTAPAAKTCVLGAWGTGTVRRWYLYLQSGQATIEGYAVDGTLVVNMNVALGGDVFGEWTRWQLYAEQNGPTVDWRSRWIRVGSTGGSISSSYAGSVGRLTDVVGPPDAYAAGADGMALGHIAVFPTANTVAYNSADHGFTGETASNRIVRLTEEEGIPVSVAGVTWMGEAMGPQRPETLSTLLEECAESDGGLLGEARERLALAYRQRTTLYNQTPAAVIPYGSLTHPFQPTEDDQHLVNDSTVQRAGGSWARYAVETGPMSTLDPEDGGIGVYDENISLSLAADSQALDVAAWRVHMGTWDEARYPQVRIMLHKHPELIPTVVGLSRGDIIRITDLPDFLPPGPVDLMVMGGSETLGQYEWDVVLSCVPAGPWSVAVADDPILGRADTEGSQLAASVSSSALSMSVATTSGPLWTTAPAEFPFDVLVGGERVTVSGISGAASPQTFTLSARSVNGVVKGHSAGADVRLAQPAHTSH